MKKKQSKFLQQALTWLGLIATGLFLIFPIFWLLITAFKQPRDAYTASLFFEPTLANFQAIFSEPNPFEPLVINSVIVSVVTVAVAIPIATAAAYSFSRYRFRAKDWLLVWVLSSQFVPPVVIVIPFFGLFRGLGLIDTRIGLIILNISITLPFAIWMIKGFIDGLPLEIEEAAFVDGANTWQLIRHVTLPLIMPGVVAAGIFSFILAWNEFLFALIMTQKDAKTLTIGLVGLGSSVRGAIWEQMAAAGLIVMIPIFLLSLTVRKYFVQGITMGAVK